MDIYEAHGIVTLDKANAMIGEMVSAVGTCGTGDGVPLKGLLMQVSPTPILYVPKGNGRMQPYAVAKNTLVLLTKAEIELMK
jgi:hypothetical protein